MPETFTTISELPDYGSVQGTDRIAVDRLGAAVSAGAFVVDQAYQIVTVGSTNFVAIGAASNTVGAYFVATGAGAGTGTAAPINTGDAPLSAVAALLGAGAPGAAATVAVGTVTTGAAGSSATVTNAGTSSAAVLNFAIPRGDAGANGSNGTAATIAVGTVTTGAAGSSAAVSNSGTSGAATLNFTIPRGDAGTNGTAATVAVGTVTTGAAGSSAAVSNSGTSSAATLDFTIPRGDAGTNGTNGTAATITVGTVTTGAAGSAASVTNSGTPSAAVFNFTIPRGDTGTGGTGSFDPASPGAIGGTTAAAGSFTALSASASLLLPSTAGTAARHLYASGDTIRYRDSSNAERLVLNATDNLAGLASRSAARANLDLGTAATAAAGDFLPTTFTPGTITYAATVDLDMAALVGGYRTISLTGPLAFTTSNRASGRTVTLRLICDGTARALTFPAGWVFIGTKPSTIAASKTAVLSLTFFGTAEADCVAAYGVQT